MRRSSLLVLALLAVRITPAAACITNAPIDDFEVQGFDYILSVPGTQEFVQAIAPPNAGHVVTSTRRITLQNANPANPARARLVPTAGSNDWVELTIPFNTTAFEYRFPSPIDLTAGGCIDHIDLEMTPLAGSAPNIGLVGAPGAGSWGAAGQVTGSSRYTWFLEDAAGAVDLTRIEKVLFYFHTGNYIVGDIRLRGTGATDVEILEQFVAVQTPPIPTPPLRWELWDPSTGPLFEAQVAITQANAGFVPEMELHYEPGYGITGQFAGMLLDWTDSAPFTTTHFEFSVGVAEVENWFPELYPPDPIQGPAGVALAFPVVVREFAGGPVLGISDTWLTFDVAPGQGAEFDNVTVSHGALADWGTGFVLAFDLVETGGVEGGGGHPAPSRISFLRAPPSAAPLPRRSRGARQNTRPQ